MENLEAIEKLKAIIIENNLPQTDMSLFGIKCPYCGKSDRIRKLEPPEDLTDVIDSEVLKLYGNLWRQLNQAAAHLGTCKFCLNPVELLLSEGHAKVLDHD
ncbi:MAG: hypothetical protein WBM78_14065 [Desulfobacterales bacterium]